MTLFLIPSVPDKAVSSFCKCLYVPLPPPYAMLKLKQNCAYTLYVGLRRGRGGEGVDRACVVKKRRLNRLFVAGHSRGTKPSYWKARDTLGKDEQKEIIIFKNDVRLFCLVSFAFPILQHGGQIQVENFSK